MTDLTVEEAEDFEAERVRMDLPPTYEDGGQRRELEESEGVRGNVELLAVDVEELVLATVEYEAMDEDRS